MAFGGHRKFPCTAHPVKCVLQELLSATAVLKLNGGLGTSMGLEKAKSLLVVKDNKTFLDLIAEQIKYTRKKFDSDVRFVLMNSFSTSDDTKEHLAKSHKDLISEEDVELLQNKSPKVDAKTLEPATWQQDPDLEWYGFPLCMPALSLPTHSQPA